MNVIKFTLEDKERLADIIREENLEKVNRLVEEVEISNNFYTRYGKRAIDIVLASIGVVITTPVNLMLAIGAFIDVGSPIMFKQSRMGKDFKPFYIYKFRSMTNATDEQGNLLPASERLTKWGKFVRKTSLDELLNFVSILKGDMSIIGPRPLLERYARRFNKRDRQRYSFKPGLECPTYYKLDHAMGWKERIDNDIWYVQNCSFKTDVVLAFRLFLLVFNRKATKVRSEASIGGFLGYDEDGSIITTYDCPEKYYKIFCERFGDKYGNYVKE